MPKLSDQVAALQAQVSTLQSQDAALQSQVSTLQSQVQGLTSNLLFVENDKIVAFDPGTGLGAQSGTVTGKIKGVSLVNFQWTITSFPNYTFNNRVGITDTDGDQVIFRNVGTARFLVPALLDPSLGGNPGTFPYQVFGNGLGGPQTGTYEVLAATGKYATMFSIGQIFPSHGVSYNPSSPPTAPGSTGSAYVEVSAP